MYLLAVSELDSLANMSDDVDWKLFLELMLTSQFATY
jgi:hypothetical protein